MKYWRHTLAFCIATLIVAGVSPATAQGVVATNQTGYKPSAAKYVFVSAPAESARVVEIPGGTVRMTIPLSISHVNDPATGRVIRRGDFSSLSTTGQYKLVASSGHESQRIEISDTVYNDTFRKALRAFFYQRCGVALLPEHAGQYWHPQCHPLDALLHPSTDSSGFRLTVGGWHDAGDYGKYVVNAGITVATLMMAYEYFPAYFSHDNLGIPESGNGIPDILDECRYELNWLLTMQRSDGGVYFKLTRTQFEGIVMPQHDTAVRYLYAVSSTATASVAAVLARAARIYSTFDSSFARQCSAAALQAWSYLAAHPVIVPPGGFRNPSGTGTGEYGDSDDSDERLWAVAELFVTTGGTGFNNSFILNYSSGGVFNSTMSWQNVRSMAQLTYLRSMQSGTDPAVKAHLRHMLEGYCQVQIAKRNSSGYHVVLAPGDYTWGSNSSVLNAAMLLIIGSLESGSPAAMQTAADQLHYILGANAHGLSFVTGVGSRTPLQPHHRPSAADGIVLPVPGMLVGGSNQYLSDPVLQALFSNSTPPALCYVDTFPSYASNEIAINWNAPLVFVAGYFAGRATTGVSEPEGSATPASGFLLRQNYPNPFNGMTTIAFHLPGEDEVTLQIMDVLGRPVLVESLGKMHAGDHSMQLDTGLHARGSLSTGVYFMRMTGVRYISNVRKLVLLN